VELTASVGQVFFRVLDDVKYVINSKYNPMGYIAGVLATEKTSLKNPMWKVFLLERMAPRVAIEHEFT
jgi:hypothetical protein